MFTPSPHTGSPFARVMAWSLAALLILGFAGLGAGCERKPTYSQKTPDDVVASAVKMVKNNDAKHLADLFYAEGPEMRSVLNRLGSLFEKLQLLAAQVQQRMPDEVAALKAQAMDSAAESAPLGAFLEEIQRRPERSEGDVPEEGQRDVIQGAIARLFADPYGWLDRNASRLSTVKLADDIAAIMIDNQPVMPPVGITMRLEKNGKWYIVLPTNLPVVSNYMPRTRDEWSIIASVIKVIENVAIELTEDVRTGRINRLDTLGSRAGDKVILPGLMAFAAYGKEMDARQRRDGITKAFKTRLREWGKQRGGDKSVSPVLLKTIDAIAPDQIAKLARAPRRTGIAEMSDADFTQFLQTWLGEAGIKADLAFGVDTEEVSRECQRWLDDEAARKAAEAAKKAAKKKR